MSRRPFLTARWERLVLLNYEADPALLHPRVPAGTELDVWQGRCLISLVGFMFLDTRLLGVPIPGHRNFEEVNLRFYVRRRGDDGAWKRAVVFVRELVPRWAIAALARRLYNEPYLAVPMSHEIRVTPEAGGSALYGWRYAGASFELGVETHGPARPLVPGSEAEFITEHYWGYTRQRDAGTVEYEVQHPPWRVWNAVAATLDCDVRGFYGAVYAEALSVPPCSAFLAEGSEIAVLPAKRI